MEIKHHRVFRLGDRLADDVNAFRFELLEMRERRRRPRIDIGRRDHIVGGIKGWGESIHGVLCRFKRAGKRRG